MLRGPVGTQLGGRARPSVKPGPGCLWEATLTPWAPCPSRQHLAPPGRTSTHVAGCCGHACTQSGARSQVTRTRIGVSTGSSRTVCAWT